MAGAVEVVQVGIQVAALLSVFEQYQRRGENCPGRLVGAILGSVSSASDDMNMAVANPSFIAEVRHAFPVPHSEFGEQVSINGDYYRTRMELHRKSHGKDSILLGWYCIQQEGSLPKNIDSLTYEKNGEFIRDSFSRETGATGAPVTLNLAITIKQDGQINFETFKCNSITPRTQPSSCRSPLEPVPCLLTAGVPDLFAVNILSDLLLGGEARILPDGKMAVPLPSQEGYKKEWDTRLESIIGSLKAHVDDPNPEISTPINTILEAFGLTPSSVEEKSVVTKNKKDVSDALSKLNGQLSRADELLRSTTQM